MTELPTTFVQCPYCWQDNELIVDVAPERQTYIEDCHVCCRPMIVTVEVDSGGEPYVEVRGEDD